MKKLFGVGFIIASVVLLAACGIPVQDTWASDTRDSKLRADAKFHTYCGTYAHVADMQKEKEVHIKRLQPYLVKYKWDAVKWSEYIMGYVQGYAAGTGLPPSKFAAILYGNYCIEKI